MMRVESNQESRRKEKRRKEKGHKKNKSSLKSKQGVVKNKKKTLDGFSSDHNITYAHLNETAIFMAYLSYVSNIQSEVDEEVDHILFYLEKNDKYCDWHGLSKSRISFKEAVIYKKSIKEILLNFALSVGNALSLEVYDWERNKAVSEILAAGEDFCNNVLSIDRSKQGKYSRYFMKGVTNIVWILVLPVFIRKCQIQNTNHSFLFFHGTESEQQLNILTQDIIDKIENPIKIPGFRR